MDELSARGRIGYLVSQYPAITHTFILREVRVLRSLGFDVVVVSIRAAERPPDALSSEEAEERRLAYSLLGAGPWKTVRALLRTVLRRPLACARSGLYALRLAGWDGRRLFRYTAYYLEAVAAGDYFLRSGVRHVHTHFSSTVALIMADLFPLTFSATIHGPDEFNDVAGFHLAAKLARAGFIAAISRYAASQIMRAGAPEFWEKIHCLPLGVDTEVFTAPPRRPSGTFRILCVGRLAPAKAHHVLLAALARMVAAGRRNLILTLVGDGPARSSLERVAQDSGLSAFVHFAGACNHERVIGFLRETDAFALASFAEGVPVALMEAMAMEVPCVATWITGIPELIRSGVDGLLVSPADPEAFASALERLMDDPELRLRLGQSARARVFQSYDVVANTQRLAVVLRVHAPGSGHRNK